MKNSSIVSFMNNQNPDSLKEITMNSPVLILWVFLSALIITLVEFVKSPECKSLIRTIDGIVEFLTPSQFNYFQDSNLDRRKK